jgi:ribosomal protein S18 acetylase RimI-like enzyme
MLIRQANIEDLEIISRFNKALAFESEGKVLDDEIVSRGASELLLNPNKGIYYVGQIEEQLVGCLMVNFQWIDHEANFITYIQSVYTRPEFRGQGVFKSLFRHAEAESRSRGKSLRLYADLSNSRAMNVYRHLGMTELTEKFYEIDFAFNK